MMKKVVIFGLILAGILLASTFSVNADYEEDSFEDPEDDVIDVYTEEETDEKPNVDITDIGYVIEDEEVTLTLTVKGDIENRGDIDDIDSEDYVYYILSLYTDSHEYYIYYVNTDCQIIVDYEEFGTIDFDYSGSTITFNFDLNGSSETYGGMYIETTDSSSSGEYTDYFEDMPEETLTVKVNVQSSGKVGQNISFSATASGGISPYVYYWDFGDGEISTDQNPYHIYTSAKTYTVNLSVMDSAGNYGLDDAKITISSTTSDGGGASVSGLLPFIVLVVVIVVAGLAVVVYVMRR